MAKDKKEPSSRRSLWLTIAGWVISVAALAYVLARLNLSELRKEIGGMTWWLVVLAIIIEIVPRLLESIRWEYLLRPIKTQLAELFQAVYVGTLYSGILPLSGGDFVRAVIVARRSRVSVTRVVSTVLVERVADALAIILLVWFTLRGFQLPYALRIALAVMEVGVVIAILAGLILAVRHASFRSFLSRRNPSWKINVRLKSIALDIVDAADRLTITQLLVTVAAALGAAAINVTAYWLILHAYHIQLSILQSAALFAIVMIGTFLPNTPGNIGTWQLFCALGLQLFGVGAARASGYSLVAFTIWTVPPVLFGVAALLVSPFKWGELRNECTTAREGEEVSSPSTLPTVQLP